MILVNEYLTTARHEKMVGGHTNNNVLKIFVIIFIPPIPSIIWIPHQKSV